MDAMIQRSRDVVILGAGPSGLSAGYRLAESGIDVLVLERQPSVGGLAKTIEHRGYRFDLGGHRFFTHNQELEALVQELIGDDLLLVERSSKILFDGDFYDYPLSVGNALSRLGPGRSTRVVLDYLWEQVRRRFTDRPIVSLEDWVVRNFGRTLFELFFKEYSEKVWGIRCDRIAREWVEQRIKGLSLGVAIKKAFAPKGARRPRTLAGQFLYPARGIGQICDRLQARIDKSGQVLTGAKVIGIEHDRYSIQSLIVKEGERVTEYRGCDFVSSIPLPALVRMLQPRAPGEVLEAASGLGFRDLVLVSLMLDRERVTDLTWMYIHDGDVPFGRIHEPKNWSTRMAPEGKTHLVAEFFCSRGDAIWGSDDASLAQQTTQALARMALIEPRDVVDSMILRIPHAYPLFEVGYTRKQARILEYLAGFSNLQLAGRGGQFEYHNTDHAMESGLSAADAILSRREVASPAEVLMPAINWARP